MKLKRENDITKFGEDKDWSGLKKASLIIGIIGAVAGLIFALITIHANFDENDRKRLNDEAGLKSQSIQCSLTHCGLSACVRIYTDSYPAGVYVASVLSAAETGRSASQCLSNQHAKDLPDRNEQPTVIQHGLFNQSNSGTGNNYQNGIIK